MTVADLMELLENADPEAEVRLAMQPSYPLQHKIRGVVTHEDLDLEEALEDDDEDGPDELAGIVWIVEGGQVYDRPYLPGIVADAAW